MENLEIAKVLSQMADLLEIQDANPFRVRAYRNAARFVDGHATPMRKLVKEESDLTSLPGIGKDMASHIRNLVTTGQLQALEELTAKIPGTLIDVMELPGVGPKKAGSCGRSSGSRPLMPWKRRPRQERSPFCRALVPRVSRKS